MKINNKITEEQNEEDNEQDNKTKPEQKSLEIGKSGESTLEGNKIPFSNLEKNNINVIEFDVKKGLSNLGEGEFFIVDNINDINLGGSTKEMVEIKKEGNKQGNNVEPNKDYNYSGNKVTQSFFESKPKGNLFDKKDDEENKGNNKTYEGIFSQNSKEHNDDNAINELYHNEEERETIQVNVNQNIDGGLEDMIFGELQNEKDVEMNIGRESLFNANNKNKLKMIKFGLDIGEEKKVKSNRNKLKSSGDLFLCNSFTKEKLDQLEFDILFILILF